MTRNLPAVLLLMLLPLAAGAQAVRPAPSTGPLIVQQPPSLPGNPVHTPTGAGASHGGLTGTQKATLPPSPNKRALPDDFGPRKAGLWAADGAPVASSGKMPAVFDIALDYPEVDTLNTRRWSDFCTITMNDTAKSTGTDVLFAPVHPQLRRCLASRAYLACAFEIATRRGVNAPDTQTAKAMEAHGKALVEFNCREGQSDPKNEPPFRAMLEQWREKAPLLLKPKTTP